MPTLLCTGDIMCQIPQNAACKTADGYDYTPVFAGVRELLARADFRVGNLETPFAGEAMGYSSERYSFNTPLAFAEAVREAGFDLVSTANNHCMDRGAEGLFQTVRSLKEIGLDSIGSYAKAEARATHYIRDIGGISIGFVAYTYGTNAFYHHRYLEAGQDFAVNLLQPEECKEGAIDLLRDAEVPLRVYETYDVPNEAYDRHVAPLLARMRSDIEGIRKAGAEFVIFLLHCGGQYNPWPDAYTLRVAEMIRRAGADAIIGHHPHVIHPLRMVYGCPISYSLGNFLFTPAEDLPAREIRSEYSIALSLHIERVEGRPVLQRMTFVPCKSVVCADGRSIALPVSELLEREPAQRKTLMEDNAFCVNKFLGRELDAPVAMRPEYDWPIA